MSYLNHDQIADFCANGGMKNFDSDCINAASMDVRLGEKILIEKFHILGNVVDYRERQKLTMKEIDIDQVEGYVLTPGQFILAHTIELCNFPDDVAALFRIKSSMGRIGLEHMDAGWVDPGFHGSLTLEFKNMTQWHGIRIRPGDKIGQLVFLRGDSVSAEQSYRAKGNYNGHDGVAQVQYK